MSEMEKKIWKQFQEEVGSDIGANPHFSEYNEVTLNLGRDEQTEPPMRGVKKVDGVVETDGKIWVCEVKPILNYKSLGQVMAYTVLYLKCKGIEKELLPLIVFAQTTSRSEGVIMATKQWGIGTFQVGDRDIRQTVWSRYVSKKERKRRRELVKEIKKNY